VFELVQVAATNKTSYNMTGACYLLMQGYHQQKHGHTILNKLQLSQKTAHKKSLQIHHCVTINAANI
jgi:hypothetical protein